METKIIDTAAALDRPTEYESKREQQVKILSAIYQTAGLAQSAARQAACADLASLSESEVTGGPGKGRTLTVRSSSRQRLSQTPGGTR